VLTLAAIERAIRESWCLETSDDPVEWSPRNPSRGQCDITALVVNDLVGGELLGASVYRDGRLVEGHMWNRLPNGLEIDLTREQFRRGELIGEPVARVRTAEIAAPEHPRYHRYLLYLVLAERVRSRLGMLGATRPSAAADPPGSGA
jgi:hypothetical protein